MDAQRYAIGVQYDGRPWLGWQSQPSGRTVQDELEKALSQFADHPVRVACAGRTDTGVHSLGQVSHFDSTAQRDLHAWVRGTNSYLPPSIALSWCALVPAAFHARFSAIARTYHYVLYRAAERSPHLAARTGWTHRTLSVERMREAAVLLQGTHDFSAFRSSQCQAKSPVKTLHSLSIRERGPFVVFTLRADAFLHHMVRNIVGSLMTVGEGKAPAVWLAEVLAARVRGDASATFMPDGLYFAAVEYPAQFVLPAPASLGAVFPGLVE